MQPYFDIVEERLEENKRDQAPFLDIGACSLRKLPERLAEFEWLEELNIVSIYYSETEGRFYHSSNRGRRNQLFDEDFSVLRGLTRLHKISARNCSIRNLEGLAELSQVETLLIGENNLSDIGPLVRMSQLQALSLFDNSISNLTPLAGLTNLRILSLNRNKVRDLTPLAGLTRLEQLFLSHNQIADITPLANLVSLQKLDLSGNQVRYVQLLTLLPSLQTLQLVGNPIEDCDPNVAFSGDVELFRQFFASMMRQSAGAIPDEAPPSLVAEDEEAAIPEVKLILVGNSTAGKTSLSKVLRGLDFNAKERSTHGIVVSEWLPTPDELKALTGDDNATPRLRVNIWDFGGQEYYHGSHQIFWDNNAVYILIWEKRYNENGAREMTVNTPGGTLNLSVEHFHYRYWLDNIRFYASGQTGGKRTPPLFLLQNKIDIEDGKVKPVGLDVLGRYKIGNYSGVSLMYTRARTPRERRYRYAFEIFKEDLLKALYEQAKENSGRAQAPQAWIRVRNLIRRISIGQKSKQKDNPFVDSLREQAWLDWADFERLSREQGVSDEQEARALAHYLDRIGAAVWMPQFSKRLYVSPSWLTEKIYKALSDRVRLQRGEFSKSDVRKELKNDAEADMILNLMREWEIIFPADDSGENWVAPQYLPEEHQMENLFRIALSGLQERYFMVKAPLFFYRKMLRRLVFRYGNSADTEAKSYWRGGILFVSKASGLRVLIKGMEVPGEAFGRLMICVEHGKADTQAWQQRILMDMLAVFSEKKQPENTSNMGRIIGAADFRALAEQLKDIALSVNGEDFISLPELVEAARKDQASVFPVGAKRRIRLRDFEPFLYGLQFTPAPPSVFISYAQEDRGLFDEFQKHLRMLSRQNKAVIWSEQEIKAGQNWEEAVRTNLANAELIVLLISPDFINSDFIWQNELQPAVERHESGACKILPVLLRPCFGEDLPILDLYVAPQTADYARPRLLSLWADHDEAWTLITVQIRKALEELKLTDES